MRQIKTYVVSRICLLSFGVGIGIHQMWQASQLHQLGAFLCGVGIFGFGVHWFLQPLVLGKREGAERLIYENAKLGSAGLRKTVEYTATGTLLLGMLLRYGFHL
jgi:hypothetical protein